MNDKLQTLQADIGFLKALAEDGRAAPTQGGSILVAAGAVFGAASLLHWGIQTGRLAASPWAFTLVWGGAMMVFWVLMLVICAQPADGKSTTAGNRATRLAWRGVGWTILTLAASVVLVAWRGNSALPFCLLPSIVMALYGLGWMVAAAISRRGWIWLTAIGSYASAIVLAAFCTESWLFILYAAALAALAIAPGLALMRQGAPVA